MSGLLVACLLGQCYSSQGIDASSAYSYQMVPMAQAPRTYAVAPQYSVAPQTVVSCPCMTGRTQTQTYSYSAPALAPAPALVMPPRTVVSEVAPSYQFQYQQAPMVVYERAPPQVVYERVPTAAPGPASFGGGGLFNRRRPIMKLKLFEPTSSFSVQSGGGRFCVNGVCP